MRQSPCSHGTLPNIAIPDETRKACFIRFPNIRYSITNNEKIEKSMSEIFSKNVIINKSDTILMQGNGIFYQVHWIWHAKLIGLRIFLRIVKVQSTQQSGIKGVKIHFDTNIILWINENIFGYEKLKRGDKMFHVKHFVENQGTIT